MIDYDVALAGIKELPEKLQLEQKKLNSSIFKATYITRLIEGDIPLYIIQNFIGIQHIRGMYIIYNKLPISKVVRKNNDLSEEYLKSLNIL